MAILLKLTLGFQSYEIMERIVNTFLSVKQILSNLNSIFVWFRANKTEVYSCSI